MPAALIVDLSRTTQAILKGLLEEAGVQALQSADLVGALECLKQHPDVALVLVEETLVQPDFVRRVRQLSRARLVVMTTGVLEAIDGTDGQVQKPFTSAWLRSQFQAAPRPSPTPAPSEGRVRVLVVDDSAVVRAVVRQVLEEDPDVEVVGTAANGRLGLDMVTGLEPDLVTLDIEMPIMDGLEMLVELRRVRPALPVVVFSSHANAVEALTRGANDVVAKPTAGGSRDDMLNAVRQSLLPRVRALARADNRPVESLKLLVAAQARPTTARVDLVAVGVSTGGPEALRMLLSDFTVEFPVPVVVVQHMPPDFTRYLAERLSLGLALPVREVVHGDSLAAGTVWVAPGGCHLEIQGAAGAYRGVLTHGEPENSCRPSVDVLFRSVARTSGAHALAVVMTGMGQDGMLGCQQIHGQGGQIIVQDRASSVVWGMPGAVAGLGLADAIVPLADLGLEIQRRVRR